MPTEAPASDKEAIPAPPALPTVHVAFLKQLDPLFKLLIWTSVAAT